MRIQRYMLEVLNFFIKTPMAFCILLLSMKAAAEVSNENSEKTADFLSIESVFDEVRMGKSKIEYLEQWSTSECLSNLNSIKNGAYKFLEPEINVSNWRDVPEHTRNSCRNNDQNSHDNSQVNINEKWLFPLDQLNVEPRENWTSIGARLYKFNRDIKIFIYKEDMDSSINTFVSIGSGACFGQSENCVGDSFYNIIKEKDNKCISVSSEFISNDVKIVKIKEKKFLVNMITGVISKEKINNINIFVNSLSSVSENGHATACVFSVNKGR